MPLQVGRHLGAVAEEHQLGEIDVEPVGAPAVGAGLHPLAGLVVIEVLVFRNTLGAEPAARCAQLVDLIQQPVLRLGRQVAEQALRDPGGGFRLVEAGAGQRGRPVLTQVDRDRVQSCGRLGAEIGQRAGLEGDHLGLVDLEHHGAGRPVQPVGTGVEARGQNHRLPDPGATGVGEEVVEEPGARGHAVGEPPHTHRRITPVEILRTKVAGGQSGEEVHPDGAHEGLGERVVDDGVVGIGGDGARGGDHRCGRPDARGEVPGVVVGAWHGIP